MSARPAPAVGYSGKPLAAKLGIAEGCRLLVVHPPQDYPALLAPLPAGIAFEDRLFARTDIVHVFALSRASLAGDLARLRAGLSADAAIWVSWPKKASKVATDITEDTIREIALPLGLVDVKVCAVSQVWSGLKLVIRKELRR